jgi:hypothetical protein
MRQSPKFLVGRLPRRARNDNFTAIAASSVRLTHRFLSFFLMYCFKY